MTITPNSLKTSELHAYLLGAISPRPICFASTIDENGNVNLSPFSFFNIFGSNPTRIIFSPARRVRDNTIKHTLENCKATREVVINMVNYNMVQQMSLASCEYSKGINEFEKAGFTEVASEMIKAPRVKESPVQLECKVVDIIETGEEGGAGNLIICEMLCMHINENVLNENKQIDPHKIDLVARMGGDYYCQASGDAVFVVPKPNQNLGIGIDLLPEKIKNSTVLSGNDLGMLANISAIPEKNIELVFEKNSLENWEMEIKKYLQINDLEMAWQVILQLI